MFTPKMMPGQEPYTEGEQIALRLLMDAVVDEKENGGLEVGSWEWMQREIELDKRRDYFRKHGEWPPFTPNPED